MYEVGAPAFGEILSIWRSPLDKAALAQATALSQRQPRASISLDEDLSAITVYNYQYYVDTYGGDEAGLSQMLLAMSPSSQGYVGSVGFIQQRAYTLTTIPTGGYSVPDQCNIFASGTGGSDGGPHFYHFTITVKDTTGLTLLSCAPSAYTSGGIYLQGIAFEWSASTSNLDTCISAQANNCTAIRCTFTDCPVAFYAQAPGCTMKECTIFYHKHNPAGATAIKLASAQCAVIGPGELEQDSPGGASGPASCTCISIQNAADYSVVTDTHISDWSTGIDFSQGGGSTNSQIRNCEIQSFLTAINIQVNSHDGAAISGVKVISSMLARSNDSYMSMTPTPVVLIDPNGAGNEAINDVTLLGCTVYMMGNANYPYMAGQCGLQINGGTNIKVIGGTYSNNNPASGAGIAITAACGDIQIIGVNLQPMYDNGTVTSTTQCQAYGLLVTTNPATNMRILVRDCDMRGYQPITGCGVTAVSTTGVTQGLFINDCLGYNDQNKSLNGGSAPTSPVNAAICSTPYFGPSVVSFSSPTPVTINVFGQPLTLSFAVIFLPSPYDDIFFTFSSPPPHFLFSWYGK